MSYVLLLAIVLIVIFFVWYAWYVNKKKKDSKFGGRSGYLSGYASLSDSYDSPYILKNVLNPAQCQQLILYAKNKLVDSNILSGSNAAIRNSKQAWISKNDPMVKGLYSQISMAVGIPISYAEDLQVARYMPNQFYKDHHDACCDDNDTCRKFVEDGGQRILTVLIYLNKEFIGGKTRFANLGIEYKPDVGNALVFHPLAKDNVRCHPLALHSGTPVISGEKWIANIWFRNEEHKSCLA